MPIFAGLVIVPVNVLAGVGGPFWIFFQRVALTRHQVVATKAVIQAQAHTIKIIYFGVLVSDTQNWPPAPLMLCPCGHIGRHHARQARAGQTDRRGLFAWTQPIMLGVGLLLVTGEC